MGSESAGMAGSSDENKDQMPGQRHTTWKAGVHVGRSLEVPAALDTFRLALGESLHASRSAAAQKLQSGRRRMEALHHSLSRHRAQFDEQRRKRREARQAARLLEGLGSHDDTVNFVVGATAFGVMAFLAGAAPGIIPSLYVLFFAYMMPLRTVYFIKRKWQFFLIDFCYVSFGRSAQINNPFGLSEPTFAGLTTVD
jgi:hypothetical protein